MSTKDIEVMSKEEKREYRRKRRIRNQRIAIASLIGSMVILIAVVVFGVVFVKKQSEINRQQQVIEEQIAEMVEMESEVVETIEETVVEEEIIEEETTTEFEDEVVLEDRKSVV